MRTTAKLGFHRGIYCAVFYEDGKRRRASLGTNDKLRAERLLKSREENLGREALRKSGHKVGAIFSAYLEDIRGEGKVSASRISDAWKRLSPKFDALSPPAITKSVCRDYMAERRIQGVGDGTIHVELGYLRAAMRYGVRERMISSEPFIPLPKKPPPKTYSITKDEARLLIQSAEMPHARLFLVLALATAGRSSAILELTWDRVDLEGRAVQLSTGGAGEATKGRATVPLNDMALQALQDAKRGAVSGYVIEWGGKRVLRVTKAVAGASRRSGIHCTPHVLRHTAAVWMAGAGISMSKIAQYLGHRDSRTTERIYARYSPGHLRDAAGALEL